MPDDEAMRARRSRAHRAGEHHLCRAGRCVALAVIGSDPATDRDDDQPVRPGAVETAVSLFAATLRLPESDVRAPMMSAATVLAKLLDEGVQPPAVARELGKYLRWAAKFEAAADELDEIRSRLAHREATAIVARLRTPAGAS